MACLKMRALPWGENATEPVVTPVGTKAYKLVAQHVCERPDESPCYCQVLGLTP